MRIPYPNSHLDFFESVRTKRFFAWLIDSAIVLAILIITSPFTFFVSLFLFPFFYAAIGWISSRRFFILLAFMCPMPLFLFNSYQLA